MANQQCDRLIEYFNGDLGETEKQAFEEHLRECSECREELEELRALTEDLPYASEPVEPPADMKERILANVFAEEDEKEKEKASESRHQETEPVEPTPLPARKGQEKPPRKMNWWIPLLAAVLLLSLLGNAYSLFNEKQNGGNGTEVAEAIKTVQLKAASGTENSQASATLLKTDTGRVRVVVEAKDLQQLKGTKVYQVWLIDGKKPYRAGTFIPNRNGTGGVAYKMDLPEYHSWDKVAISLEPTKNSQTPQGKIILASTL